MLNPPAIMLPERLYEGKRIHCPFSRFTALFTALDSQSILEGDLYNLCLIPCLDASPNASAEPSPHQIA